MNFNEILEFAHAYHDGTAKLPIILDQSIYVYFGSQVKIVNASVDSISVSIEAAFGNRTVADLCELELVPLCE